MPQMAPLWWFSLFAMFMLTFMFMCMNMYFLNYKYMQKMEHLKNKTNKTNWKW